MTLIRPALPFTLILAAGAVAAQDACPTSADLAGGIRVDLLDGNEEVFTGTPERLEVQGFFDGEFFYKYTLINGYHAVLWVDYDYGEVLGRTTYAFGMPAADLPVPRPDTPGPHVLQAAVLDYGQFYGETQTLTYVGEDEIDFGGCTYRAEMSTFDITDTDGYAWIYGMAYFPDLGFSLITYLEEDGYREDYGFGGISAE